MFTRFKSRKSKYYQLSCQCFFGNVMILACIVFNFMLIIKKNNDKLRLKLPLAKLTLCEFGFSFWFFVWFYSSERFYNHNFMMCHTYIYLFIYDNEQFAKINNMSGFSLTFQFITG